jgi:hypothetical protein
MSIPKMLSANIVKKTSINGIAVIPSNESEVKFVTYGTFCHFKVWTVDLNSPGKVVQGQAVPKLVAQKVKISNDPLFIYTQVIVEGDLAYIIGFA